MSTTTDVRRTVLWAAIEDYAGLWEVVWELNSIELPVNCEPARLARSVVHDLLALGWVEIYQCTQPDGEMIPVAPDVAPAMVDDDDNWVAPARNKTSIHVSATESGEQAYRRS